MAILAFRNISFTVKYFPLFFSAVSLSLGVAVCEFSQISLYEISSTSQYIGSLPTLVFLYTVFFFSLSIFDKPRKGNIKLVRNFSAKQERTCHYISILSTAILFIMFVRIARYPAFLLGYDRFLYSSNIGYSQGIWRLFESISYALIVFPFIDFVNGHKKIGTVGLLSYVLFYLWNGNKFGPFFTLIVVALIVYYNKLTQIKKKAIKKYIYLGICVMILLVVVAAVIQSTVSNNSIVDYLGKRVAQQGQLWWRTYDKTSTWHISEFGDELRGLWHGSSVVSENVNANYGIYKVMYYCGNPSYISFKLGAGSRFTEAGFAGAYYYLGILGGILFSIINAYIMSHTLNALVSSLRTLNVVKIAILLRLYTIERISFSMFLFNDYLDSISVASYIVLCAMFLFEKGKRKNAFKRLRMSDTQNDSVAVTKQA